MDPKSTAVILLQPALQCQIFGGKTVEDRIEFFRTRLDQRIVIYSSQLLAVSIGDYLVLELPSSLDHVQHGLFYSLKLSSIRFPTTSIG